MKECAKGVLGLRVRDVVIHPELLGTYFQKVRVEDNNASFNFCFEFLILLCDYTKE